MIQKEAGKAYEGNSGIWKLVKNNGIAITGALGAAYCLMKGFRSFGRGGLYTLIITWNSR